jgi:hypothetical protein
MADAFLRPLPLSQRVAAIATLPELADGRPMRQLGRFAADHSRAFGRRLGLVAPQSEGG